MKLSYLYDQNLMILAKINTLWERKQWTHMPHFF